MKKICVLVLLAAVNVCCSDVLFDQSYGGDVVADWANGGLAASVSGYNNGSVMNEGRKFVTADDFVIAGDRDFVIEGIGFISGTELAAEVSNYRVSIYSGNGSMPVSPDEVFFNYEEEADKLSRFDIVRISAEGDFDRYVEIINLDTSGLGLSVQNNVVYYISIEGDCYNSENIYNGYDTYYQRFYMLGQSGDGLYWNAGKYDGQWSQWGESYGNMLFTIEGFEVPEPASFLMFGFSAFLLYRNKK